MPHQPAFATLTWALAIATYARHDELLRCVDAALAQTVMPAEIVIADSTTGDTSAFQAALAKRLARAPSSVRCEYIHSAVAQQTVQRNLAASRCTADVLFMIDDDTFMHPHCAEILLGVYTSELGTPVAAVTALDAGVWPIDDLAVSASQSARGAREQGTLWDVFLPANFRRGRSLATYRSAGWSLSSIRAITGAYITVRRDLVRREPFDEKLVLNVFEDAEATMRFLQHGALVQVQSPLMFHAQAARPAGQTRRGSLNRFAFCLDQAYMVRKLVQSYPRAALHVLINHARVIMIDLVRVVLQRQVLPLIGSLHSTPKVLRLLATSRENLGDVVVSESRKAMAALHRPAT